jgi:DNA-binding protein H-NS
MLTALAIDYFLLSFPRTQEGAQRRLQLMAGYGVNVLDYVEQPAAQASAEQAQQSLDGVEEKDPDDDDDDTPPPVVTPTKKNVARYRNATTGETWSGRGLQPKWLKAAIAAGAKLTDYVVAEVA